MSKKDRAQDVNQAMLGLMDLPKVTSSVSDAGNAGSDLFGNGLMSKNVMSFLGSGSGFKKATLSEDLPNSRTIAPPRSNKSKIIGSINHRNETPFSLPYDTSFMTELTLAETTASSLL